MADQKTVIDLATGEILSTHSINPDRGYWRNQQESPTDGQGVTNDSTHLSHMTRLITTVELLGRYSKTPVPLAVPGPRRRGSSLVVARRIHAARKRLGPDVIQQLVTDYEAGHSTTALMQTYGLGKGTVLGILEERGVKMRGQGIPDDRLGEVIGLYRGGLTLMQISKRFHCSGETVRQALLAAEVRMRAKWERGPLRPS
jgi:hypothetical protein